MMRPYSEVAAEIAQRNANNYVPPSIPAVKQTPVEIPGVMYQARGNTLWTTDKVEFSTSLSNVTFQVSAVQLTYKQTDGNTANATMTTPVGNLYANAISVPGNTVSQYYVGAGNYLNIVTGAGGFTATALGTATSATAASNGIATPAT